MKENILAVVKLFFFLLILPLIIAFIISFQNQILLVPGKKAIWLFWGAGAYVALNLFVYDLKNIYDSGKSLVEKMFSAFKPAGYIFPIFSFAIIIIFVVLQLMRKDAAVEPYFLFAIAFTLAMHLIQSAHEIYEADSSFLKAHYFLSFGAVLIVSIFLVSLLFAWIIPEYSFIGFIKSLSSQTIHLYKFIYKALFVDTSH